MAGRLCLGVFLPPLLLQKDLLHQASQGAVPVESWPFSELGYLEGSFRDEASFLAFLRLLTFWTRHPGTAEGLFCAVLLALWLCASTSTLLQEGPGSPVFCTQSASETTPLSKGRVDCHRLRQSQCDRFPPSLLKAFCSAPLLSCQRLGTSQTWEWMGATLRLATRQHPPNAGPDVHPRDFSCYGVPLRAWDGYPPLRGKPFHRPAGQTCLQDKAQIGTPWTEEHANVFSPNTVSLSGRACCAMGVGLRLRPCSCVRYRPVTDGLGSARSDGSGALTTNHPCGPSLVVRSYPVWDATRWELWETALLSTTRRLPVREYWTQ